MSKLEELFMSKLACQATLIETKETVSDCNLTDFPKRMEPGNVLMCPPTYFNVESVQNPFMDGKVGTVDKELAKKQWQDLKEIYTELGCEVKTVEAVENLEDMVFAANQVLPGIDDNGKLFALLGEMRHEKRRREVPWYRQWFLSNGYRVLTLADGLEANAPVPRFEAQGDAIWHPSRKFLWGGFGSRTDKESYPIISKLLNIPIVLLKLADPRFYHLDTCFCAINEDTVMIFEGAFDAEGLALIKHFFKNVIAVSEKDALNFALNAVPIKDNVILQKGSEQTVESLRKYGLNPIEVDTSEFMKSGGSVFCMKMMVY